MGSAKNRRSRAAREAAATALEIVTHTANREGAAALAKLRDLAADARAYATAARAPRTRESYSKRWAGFTAWCAAHGVQPLPCSPATLAMYLTDRARSGTKPATLQAAMSAIAWHHSAAGIPRAEHPHRSPQLQEIWRGIRRAHGVAPRRVAPVVVDELRAMVEALRPGLIGARDRALLVIGFAGAFRRSELGAFNVDDVAFTREGLRVTVRRSKTDQESAGAEVGLPYGSTAATCPVRALRDWLDASGVTEGALFRSVHRSGRAHGRMRDRDVARVVKLTAASAGLNPALYSGHSLRAGLASSAARAGKADRDIMRQGRWSGRAMVDRYVRGAKLLDKDNAAAGIGL